MLVVLQTTSSGARAQRIQLRTNQVARIGRSEWADFCFDADSAMSDVHLEVRSMAEACIVRSLNPETPTYVNGAEVQTASVHDGDRILAGRTEFLVHIESERLAIATEIASPTDPALPRSPTEVGGAVLSLVAVCTLLEFHEDICSQAAVASSPDQLIAKLAEEEKFMDALRLRAYLLSKREAVWWGCLCVRDDLDVPLKPSQANAVRAAAAWVARPDEEHRRAAEQQAAAAKYSGVGATLALSAFWSDGSIAPAENPEVLPDERLTSQGVAAALISAAYMGDATKANGRIEAFLAKGKQIACRTIPLPEGEV